MSYSRGFVVPKSTQFLLESSVPLCRHGKSLMFDSRLISAAYSCSYVFPGISHLRRFPQPTLFTHRHRRRLKQPSRRQSHHSSLHTPHTFLFIMLCTRCLYNILDKYIPTCATAPAIRSTGSTSFKSRFIAWHLLVHGLSLLLITGLQVLTTSFANEGMLEIIGEEEE